MEDEYMPCEDPECYDFWPEQDLDGLNDDALYIKQLEDERAMEDYFLRIDEDRFNHL